MTGTQSYADDIASSWWGGGSSPITVVISAWGGWGSWPMMSTPVVWPGGGGGISVPTIDFTLVKQLRFSIFKVFEGTIDIGK